MKDNKYNEEKEQEQIHSLRFIRSVALTYLCSLGKLVVARNLTSLEVNCAIITGCM